MFGDAPNVAARVQAAAEPGSVLITASVQRQTAGLFVVEDKGAHDLKGVTAPVALYRVVRASGGGRRGGARALTPLVGREDELALLTRRWSRALEGEGQFVQIVGEPGIGKSRLSRNFAQNSRRRRTPGSNGPPRSSCRTRPCTRSPNGADCALAAPTRPTRGVSPTSRTLYVWLASTRTNTRP